MLRFRPYEFRFSGPDFTSGDARYRAVLGGQTDRNSGSLGEYCESDVVSIYRVWLRYELFRGRLSAAAFQASEANLAEFIRARGNVKPYLTDLM